MIEFDYKKWGFLRAKQLYFADHLPSPKGYDLVSCNYSYHDLPCRYPYERKYVKSRTTIINLLQNSDDLLSKVHNRRRSVIRRSLKMGFQFEYQMPSLTNLNEFRYLYNKFIGPKVGSKMYSIMSLLPYSPYLSVFCGKYENKTLCMMLVLHDGRRAILHMTARDESFDESPKRYINSFLLWEVLAHFKKLGYHTFDLGGIFFDATESSSGDTSGVSRFKMSFGGEVIPIYHYEAVVTFIARTSFTFIDLAKRLLRIFLN